jgi:hypothetical protein
MILPIQLSVGPEILTSAVVLSSLSLNSLGLGAWLKW